MKEHIVKVEKGYLLGIIEPMIVMYSTVKEHATKYTCKQVQSMMVQLREIEHLAEVITLRE